MEQEHGADGALLDDIAEPRPRSCTENYAWFSTALFAVACLAFINGIKNPYGATGWGLATVFPLTMWVYAASPTSAALMPCVCCW
jgi:hypothetical protein